MKFKEILNRLTGISIPIFGVQWSPSELEITKARRIISFLEDRRVLYNPGSLEVADHCVHSVLEIRKFLTSQIGEIDEKSQLAENLRAMRAACRKFLNTVQNDEKEIITFGLQPGHYASWIFLPAIGELRGVFGVHLAIIAAHYGLDVEGELASILPDIDKGNSIKPS